MIRACIFDLGGTIVDRYSLTPFLSLKKVFNNHNISVTNQLIFKDMGKNKKDHLIDILSDQKIMYQWINNYHGKVKRNLSRFMNLKEKMDLTKACSPI